MDSLFLVGVSGRADFSGEAGDEGMPSIMSPLSRTLGVWTDCILRCGLGRGSGRSGDTSVSLLERYGFTVRLASRAFSVRAA